MVMDEEKVLKPRQITSTSQAMVVAHLPPEYMKIKYFRNKNLRILSEYFEMRRYQFDFNFNTFDTLNPLRRFDDERKKEWKYMGKQIFLPYRLLSGGCRFEKIY